MTTIRHILVWILVIGVLGALLFPIFAQPKLHDHNRTDRNYFHIAGAIQTYATDYDDIYPPATSEPTLRVLIYPYLRSDYYFLTGKKTGPVHFNFNLAGVSVTAPPYPNQDTVDLDDVVLAYARNPQKRDEFFVAYGNWNNSTLTSSQLLKALKPQFDRKGVILMPADYLADQDPLKNKK